MRKSCALLLTLALAASGCLEMPKWLKENKPAPPSDKTAVKSVPPLIPVTTDDITDVNAHAKASSLDEEITRDEENEGDYKVPTTTSEPASKKK